MVVLVLRGDHRSITDDELCGGATPARFESEATGGSRMRDLALQMSMLTLKLKVWTAPAMVDGDDGDWRFPGDVPQKGTPKLTRFLAPLDAGLLPDAP